MKSLRNNIFIVLFTLIISVINLTINVIADPIEKIPIPNHTIITAKDGIINVVGYENFYLQAQRIESDVGIGYCIEVEKDYPIGQNFEFVGKPARQVVGMMAAGYPNKTAAELGLTTDDNAYFATQIAIWCVTEGYPPNKFKSKDKELLQAIKNIYEEGMQYTGNDLDYTVMEYYYSDSIQRIVIYINKKSKTTDEGKDWSIGIRPNIPSEEVPTLPEVPDDENASDESNKVIVPGLG